MIPSIRRRYKPIAPLVERTGKLMVFFAYGKRAFLRTEDGLRRADCPALVYHSRDDTMVDYRESFLEVQEALADRKDIVFIGMNGRNHDVYLLPENSRRQREIRKMFMKEPGAEHDEKLRQELWHLMCGLDEELAVQFIDFYKECLKRE